MYKKRLLDIGIPANLSGIKYLNYALEHCDPYYAMGMYRTIAEHFDVKPANVERAMRFAVNYSGEKTTPSRFVAKHQILWRNDENGIHN